MLKIKGSVATNELVDELKVSKMTINRDFKELESSGVAELFHGGAMYKEAGILEYPILVKQDLLIKEKQQIADLAAQSVEDDSSVFIETGTTTLYVALELLAKKNCTFYTNSLSVANYFSKIQGINLHMVPGRYREMSAGFLGVETVEYIKDLYFDYCFIGTDGIAQDGKISVHSEENALTKKNVIAHSKQRSLVFDRSKVGKKLLHGFGNITDFDRAITDYQDLPSFLSQSLTLKTKILSTN